MSSKQMTECVCDRCGATESVEQVMGANVFPRGWLTVNVTGASPSGVRDLCENCAYEFAAFLSFESTSGRGGRVSQSNESKV